MDGTISTIASSEMKQEGKNQESLGQLSSDFAELLVDFSTKSSAPPSSSRRRRGRARHCPITQEIVEELRGESDSTREQMNDGSRKEIPMQCEPLELSGQETLKSDIKSEEKTEDVERYFKRLKKVDLLSEEKLHAPLTSIKEASSFDN